MRRALLAATAVLATGCADRAWLFADETYRIDATISAVALGTGERVIPESVLHPLDEDRIEAILNEPLRAPLPRQQSFEPWRDPAFDGIPAAGQTAQVLRRSILGNRATPAPLRKMSLPVPVKLRQRRW